MTLHFYYSIASTPCRATLLTLMSLNITFEKHIVNLSAKEQLKPDFLQINPHHKLPTIVDEGCFKLWESHAINAYLATKYDKTGLLCPQDPQQRALIDQRLHFDTDTLFPCFRQLVVEIVKEQRLKSVTIEMAKSFKSVYDSIGPFFCDNKYIVGDNITIADFSFLTSLSVMDLFVPIKVDTHPILADYIVNAEAAIPHFNEVNEPGLEEFKHMCLRAGFKFPK